MKTQLINSMTSFVLGGGITLASLLAWTGTTDLQAIKDSVQSYVDSSEQQASALLSEYNVMVESANAEIADYQKALEKANSNISQLIEKYEQDQAQAGEDISDLQAELEAMQARLDQQYETDMSAIIAEANTTIKQANDEVAQAKTDVNEIIGGSEMTAIAGGEKSVLDTTGDKTVANVSEILGLQLDSFEFVKQDDIMYYYQNGAGENSYSSNIYKVEFNNGKTYYVGMLYNNKELKGLSTDGEKFDSYSQKDAFDTEFDTTYKTLFDESLAQYLASQE